MALFERFQNAWSAFKGRDPTLDARYYTAGYGSYGTNPGMIGFTRGNAKSVVVSVYNQIAVDCAQININHVIVNEDNRYVETINSPLNYALTTQANIDQTGRELIKAAVISLLDEGCVAIVPVKTDKSIYSSSYFKIYELRVGKILEWFPYQVRVEVYNEDEGKKDELLVDKQNVCIIENPFYSVMNEQNSTAQRLIRTLGKLDQVNSAIKPNNLDLIIQVPYNIKTELADKKAKTRRKSLEDQLQNSPLGIGYIDGTEKVIQLNRSLENGLWEQAKDLQQQLFNQLGFSQAVFDGTADEQTMLNYQNRCLEPIMSAITENMERKWISPTARTQGQAIRFFKDPFKLVPVAKIAEIADKFTRNEIMSSNEIRSIIGMKPSSDPKADELRNSNLNHPDEKAAIQKETKIQNEEGVNNV